MFCTICNKEIKKIDEIDSFLVLKACSPSCLKKLLELSPKFTQEDLIKIFKENDISVIQNKEEPKHKSDKKAYEILKKMGFDILYKPYTLYGKAFIRYRGQPVFTRKITPTFFLNNNNIFLHLIHYTEKYPEHNMLSKSISIIPIFGIAMRSITGGSNE